MCLQTFFVLLRFSEIYAGGIYQLLEIIAISE